MKIAVVGAGIFGVTAALHLDAMADVTLFEKQDRILAGASFTNQYRLHRGYHYPRSPETVQELLGSVQLFRQEYGEAVIDDYEHYYCISKRDSLTSASDYLKFCKEHKLEYEIVDLDEVNSDAIDLCIRAEESLIDPYRLLSICRARLQSSSVDVKFNTWFLGPEVDDYDVVVNCTYANLNSMFRFANYKREYQYELCEKIVVQMPLGYTLGKNIVIMDGPFMCVDQFGPTSLSLWGNVVHAIHDTNIGYHPFVSNANYYKVLDKGLSNMNNLLRAHIRTRFTDFIDSGKEFIPRMEDAQYVGSMFTIRTVLPRVDDTDERPTIVTRVDDKIINVFSGKIDTCVKAAQNIVDIIR